MRAGLVCLLLGAALSTAAAASGRMDDWRAIEDSLRTMHPRYRARWLRDHGHTDHLPSPSVPSDSGPLQLVGRWSYGPAYDVDCRITASDTLIAMGRGSGVSLLSFNRTRMPRLELLSDVNAERLLNQVSIRDTLLYVGTNAGLEVYDISDERDPQRLSWIRTGCAGFDVKDSLAFITWCDTFKVYSIADPADPYRVGWCQDSGATVTVAGNTVLLVGDGELRAIDIGDPSSPHRVGNWGTHIVAAQARGNICCVTQTEPDRFIVLDIADPSAMRQLGSLDGVSGWDLHLDGPLAYLSAFDIVSIADSTHPQLIGSLGLSVYKYGVWGHGGFNRALVANFINGLVLVDLSNMSSPRLDTAVLGASSALDLEVHDGLCYVADEGGGLKILDVTDPTQPTTIGELDTLGGVEACYSVAANDSFAYVGWFNFPPFRSVDISDPMRPRLAGLCDAFDYAQDMELRDTLVYCADDYKLEVVNVARPREPEVVGSLNLPERSQEVILDDSLAYVANYGGVIVANVARPDSPHVIATWPRYVWGIDLQDTVLYVLSYTSPTEDVIISLSVSDPSQLCVLDSLVIPRTKFDVLVVDTIAYCGGWELDMVSVANPRELRPIEGRWVPPSFYVRRLAYVPPYIYVAATDGGVCILETLQTGQSENAGSTPAPVLRVWPSVTTGIIRMEVSGSAERTGVEVCDVAGAVVLRGRTNASSGQEMDLSRLPAGVYVVTVRTPGGGRFASKVVVVRRR